jgi:hypothetical protein
LAPSAFDEIKREESLDAETIVTLSDRVAELEEKMLSLEISE